MASNTIIYFLRSPEYVRHHRNIITGLQKSGYKVAVIFDPTGFRETSREFAKKIEAELPGVSFKIGLERPKKRARPLIFVRDLASYRRFFFAPHQSYFYQERWLKYFPRFLIWLIQHTQFADRFIKSRLVGYAIGFVERVVSPYASILAEIKSYDPCLSVIVYRSLPSNAPDIEYLKASLYLGVPTVVIAASWDSVSTKGLLHVLPDKILVWNERQRREATEHHGMPVGRIVVIGAYQFDDWFARKTTTSSREEFCREAGLDPAYPFILYLGSSVITGDGVEIVKKLRRGLDQSPDVALRSVQILARPHPANPAAFAGLRLDGVSVYPKEKLPFETNNADNVFYMSVEYAIAAVTINTTAIIEALIKDKPGIAVLDEKLRSLQGAEHFQSLIDSGAISVARFGADFAALISAILLGRDETKEKRHRYIFENIRPKGIEVPASEVLVRELISMIAKKEK